MPVLDTIRAHVLAPDPSERRFVEWPDALIHIDGRGRIVDFGPTPALCEIPQTWPGAVVMPGFVDTHVHYPQTRILGTASGPLLSWLERSVFPEEARFDASEHATAVAESFCSQLIAQGTTCAAIYGSCHPRATDILFTELDRRGLRAVAGPALMDVGAASNVLLEPNAALDGLGELCRRWHGHDAGRLRVSVVPRFALACSPGLMRRAAALAKDHELVIQTHIAENLEEVRAVSLAFPSSRDYLGVYEDHGLVGSHTILAHCIHLDANAWLRLARAEVAVAHCPDSNFFLGSGCMRLRHALDRGVRVGLGTDVGAGRSFSLRRIAAAAYDASLLVGEPVGAEELAWLATRGGANVVEDPKIGLIAPGHDADLVVIDLPAGVPTFDALVFRHDAGPVRATLVRGRVLA